MTSAVPSWLPALESEGYAIVSNVLDLQHVQSLISAVEGLGEEKGVRARRSSTYAVRNLLSLVPQVRQLAQSESLLSLVEPVLGSQPRAVRGLLFDKSPDANWKVAWHQDLSIAVRQRIDLEGFGPWSEKAGVPHVQPPVSVLQKMLTVRLHLDDCTEENGPLQVLPGSHRLGLIPPRAIDQLHCDTRPVICTIPAGGAILMRPLTLHASSAATAPTHRRVVHIEYASADALPPGIEWHES